MGILNVTPDSFSDGGRYEGVTRAVQHARDMVNQGADIVDVGGESTRPGAEGVSVDEEVARVVPVIETLRGESDIAISIDTMKSDVARAALAAGADIINDVSAMTYDPEMVNVARSRGAGVVLMHMQGDPRTMQREPTYDDVTRDVAAYLKERLAFATAAGIDADRLCLDPGIGFGKTLEHNLQLLRELRTLLDLGRPVLVGLSRKSFLGALTGRSVGDRLGGSLAALAHCVRQGVQIMRVHDVAASCDAARVAVALGAA